MSDLDSLDPNSLVNMVRDLTRRINALELRTVQVDTLDELTDDLGMIAAGETSGYGFNLNSVADGDLVVVPEGHVMLTGPDLTVDGEFEVYGDVILI